MLIEKAIEDFSNYLSSYIFNEGFSFKQLDKIYLKAKEKVKEDVEKLHKQVEG